MLAGQSVGRVATCLALLCWTPAAAADEWWGQDKALHFTVSAVLGAGTYGIGSFVLKEPWQRAAVSAFSTLAVGAGKELWDRSGHGDPSWKDMAWNGIGTTAGVGLALSVDLAVFTDRSLPIHSGLNRFTRSSGGVEPNRCVVNSGKGNGNHPKRIAQGRKWE